MPCGSNLAQPQSFLIPSVDGDVLTVLSRTQAPLTGRRIASLTRRGSCAAAQAVLDRLVDHGQPAGPAVLYTLNRNHLLAEPVIAAVTARDRLLIRLHDHIDSWPVPAVHASLFGSTALGEAGASSDLDIMVILPDDVDADDPAWAAQLVELERLVAEWTGNPLAWFETDQASLDRATSDGESLLDSLRRDGIHLAGARFGALTPEERELL